MAGVIARINRNRSSASSKRAGQPKKAGSAKANQVKKVQQSKKAKRVILAKPAKQTVVPKKGPSKKVTVGKGVLAKKVSKPHKPESKKPASRPAPSHAVKTPRSKSKTKQAQTAKPRAAAPPVVVEQPKAPLSANTLAAVRAFEQALKVFNRHDFPAARVSFENILEKYVDQAEVVARVRTYLAICEQRMSRVPQVPKSPDALYDQGVFEFNKGNAREALGFFERAIKADPRADHIWYSLAAAQARLGNSSAAVDALRRAIILRPVHRSHARRDPDFSGLRNNEDFQLLAGIGADFV